MSEIFIRLKEERERLKLNQHDFGAAGGVARNAQSHYESGKRLPDAGYLAAISEIGADVQYILTGIQTNTLSNDQLSEREAALVENYRASAEENKGHIEAVGSAFAQQNVSAAINS